jgi:hypothetical protein
MGVPACSRWIVAAACGLVCTGEVRAIEPESAPPGRPEQSGGIYDKPYIKRMGSGTVVGGYIDTEFEWREGKGSTFDQHRFIPFIYSEVSERVHVSAEIEFEHGGLVKGGGSTDGEIKLEYAVIDFRVAESLNYRGGVILSPLGSFNLLHDSPLNDLTERPTVDRQIIPSTLSESGMGFFGTFYPTEMAVASYEVYLVNGFGAGVINGDGQLRIRNGRGSQKQDNNSNKALVGRFGLSPRLGMNLGASFHHGAYDDAGDRSLAILALDAKVTQGRFEVQGEYAIARADVDLDAHQNAAEAQRGAYAQANVHFAHDAALRGSVFTGVVRWDWVDFDADRTGDSELGLTLGMNFRPVEEAVLKLDYNFSWKSPVDGQRGDVARRFFLSVASYF